MYITVYVIYQEATDHERYQSVRSNAKLPFCVRGVLSPLLANVLLDDVDRELEKRGHTFARYVDDCNVYVRSKRAGEDGL